jgi:hypothetical protein
MFKYINCHEFVSGFRELGLLQDWPDDALESLYMYLISLENEEEFGEMYDPLEMAKDYAMYKNIEEAASAYRMTVDIMNMYLKVETDSYVIIYQDEGLKSLKRTNKGHKRKGGEE